MIHNIHAISQGTENDGPLASIDTTLRPRVPAPTLHQELPVVETLISKVPELARLSAAEEHRLALAWRDHRDASARTSLIATHVRLVVAIAKGLHSRGIPLEELIAEGNLGLIRAVDRFDPESGCRLSTFAFRHIRHAMTALFANNSLRGKLRHDTRRRISAYEAAHEKLTVQLGLAPTDAEAAEEIGWTASEVAKIRRTHAATSRSAFLLAVQATNDEREEAWTRHDKYDHFDSEARAKLSVLLSLLSPDERRAMELLHGIDMVSSMTPQSVAKVMGLSTAAVQRLKATALSKMVRQRAMVANVSSLAS